MVPLKLDNLTVKYPHEASHETVYVLSEYAATLVLINRSLKWHDVRYSVVAVSISQQI